MASNTKLITAVDVGTTKVCAISGHRSESGVFKILAHSTVPCRGLRKGTVIDVSATRDAVLTAIKDLESMSGLLIESVFVGITGTHVDFENRRDKLQVNDDSGAITSDDLDRIPTWLHSEKLESGRKLIHAVKMTYSLDGNVGIRNPVGMHSKDVEVETHVVTGGSLFIRKLMEAVEEAGVKIESLVLEPLASGMAVLRNEEKERLAIVVDIGGGTTDIVGFKRGRICYTGVIPVGGYQFTNDIAVSFNTTYQVAETAKLKYAGTEMPIGSDDEEIELPAIGGNVGVMLRKSDITRLIRERALELIRLIGLKIEESQMAGLANVPLVLTGGGSSLPGLVELMDMKLLLKVRYGGPVGRWTLPLLLKRPSYSTGIGILMWADQEYQTSFDNQRSSNKDSRVRRWLEFWSVMFRKAKAFGPWIPSTVMKWRS